jgi:hypothetical protein
VRRGLFEKRKVLLLIDGTGIAENHEPYGMAVAPEVLVVLFEGGANLPQAISGSYSEGFRKR